MYRYLHQWNHLCSKIKLILSINGHKLNSHRNVERKNFIGVMDHTLLQKYRIYSSKKLLPVLDFGRSWTTVLLVKLWTEQTSNRCGIEEQAHFTVATRWTQASIATNLWDSSRDRPIRKQRNLWRRHRAATCTMTSAALITGWQRPQRWQGRRSIYPDHNLRCHNSSKTAVALARP